MKYVLLILLLPLVTLAADPSQFPPAKMKDLITKIDKDFPLEKNKKATDNYVAVDLVYSVLVEYTGEVRKLPPSEIHFISGFAKMRSRPAMETAFKQQIKVRQDGADYWFLPQEAFINDLSKELKPGQKFVVYLINAGRTADRNNILIMNDFNSDRTVVDAFPLK